MNTVNHCKQKRSQSLQ